MSAREYSVVFLPTLQCDARCDYCFEDKAPGQMTLGRFSVFLDRMLEFADTRRIDVLNIYWQGGEILTLDPAWLDAARTLAEEKTAAHSLRIVHFLQSNMLAYSDRWNSVIGSMFANSVGTSMDFPNRHRRMPGGEPEEYTDQWIRNVRKALDAGVHVGVIVVPSAETFKLGAEALYTFFVNEIGVSSFQVNSPFPGGQSNAVKQDLPLDPQLLGRFLMDLTDVWLERGYERGVQVGPSSELLAHFLGRPTRLSCFWQDNCANGFACVDPTGNVSQCDCWVASYPDMRFGNIFDDTPLATMLEQSSVRQDFLARPGVLVKQTDCIECEHLAVCHGGCPVRAYSTFGDIATKDPYCEAYKMLFTHVKQAAARIASS